MDYLDPKNLRDHRIRLFIGYGLVAIAIALLVVILLFQANGYNYKQGQVVRDGLIFFSSQPSNAELTVDGTPRGNTSQRLQLQAGDYHVVMSRKGYFDWRRTVSVIGGKIIRYDYPILFPKNLDTSVDDSFVTAPSLASESLDNHELLVQFPGQPRFFQLYNLALPSTIKPINITLPANILTPYKGQQSMTVVQWAKDSEHILLKHTYGKSYEYVLLDTANPQQSLNLNAALGLSPTSVALNNDYYDQYFVYDGTSQTLSSASLGTQTLRLLLKNVANYTSVDGNILYIKSSDKQRLSQIILYEGGKNYPIQPATEGTKYLLSMTNSDGNQYIVVTSRQDGKATIYKNPLSTSSNQTGGLPKPTAIMSVPNPSYQSISPKKSYILVEGGQNFAVYDTNRDQKYVYKMSDRLDAPQKHASWMREGQLDYVSSGKLLAFDFDGTNQHSLMPASASYQPFFDINYHYAYTLTTNTDKSTKAKVLLTQTPLLTAQDLQ